MVGFKDPRRKLAAKPPQLTRTWHILKLSAVTTTAAGAEQPLESDELIVLESLPVLPEEGGKLASEPQPVDLSQGNFYPIALFPARIAQETVRAFEDSVAYKRALLCKAVPDGFDSAQISPTCFFGDGASPFRSKEFAPRFATASNWPRSNLAELLLSVRKDLPDIFSELEPIISRGAEQAGTNPRSRMRMAWLKKSLTAGGSLYQPTPSLVRVVVP
jgi:hypothetical protein